MLRGGIFLLVLTIVTGCGDDSNPSPTPDATLTDLGAQDAGFPDLGHPDAAPPADAGDPTEALFDRSRLMRVDIELGAKEWALLCSQSRTLETTFARPDCLSRPFESPYTYFSGTVSFDGERFESAGIRKRGFFGSLSGVKPSLRIKLDEYVEGVKYRGLSSFNFNNAIQDPSLVKQCIGYDFFAQIGAPSPRCSFAEVSLNGQSLGVYVHLEALKKPFLRRHFSDDEGQLYEGTVSDFRDGWLGTFEQETNEDVPYDRSDLEGLTRALDADDANLLAALAPWIDLDDFFRFWAAEVLLDHWDGYAGNTNNFYVYRDPATGHFNFIPWGVDGLFGVRPQDPPFSVRAESNLTWRLYHHPQGRQRYLQTMDQMLREHWDVNQILASVDQFAALVEPAVPGPEHPMYTDALANLRSFVQGREAVLRAELDQGGVDWPNPLRAPICFDIGPLAVDFTTTFGTHPAPNILETGTGTFTATIGQEYYNGLQVGAAAGFGDQPEDMNDAVMLVAATTAGGDIPILYLAVRPDLLAPGELPMDGFNVRGGLLRIPAGSQTVEFVAYFANGLLNIREAAPMSGAPIDISVTATLLRSQE